jgi:hypothetical protein
MGRFAYLVMAHHRPDLANELINALDDVRNDIYIHIDIKSKDEWNINTTKAHIYFIESMSVNWGGYTQIQCELNLISGAVKNGPYDYYHLLTGATFPIKNQNEIHEFFEKNDYEFIGFDNAVDFSFRAKYWTLFSEAGKLNGVKRNAIKGARRIGLKLQKMFNINRLNKYYGEIKKGIAYWSITDSCAKFILSQEHLIKKMFSGTISGDELFVQTIVYNSQFRSKIFDLQNEEKGSLRVFTWGPGDIDRPGHNFILDDMDAMLNNNSLFALKFEGRDGLKIIEEIKCQKHM